MNAFAAYAEATRSPREVRKERASDRRADTRRRQKEEAQLSKMASAASRRELEEALAGPFGTSLAELRRRLRALTFADAQKLLVFIEASPLRRAPEKVRWIALKLVAKAITRVRLKEALPPFDDGLPGDAPKASAVIKELLGVT